MLYLVATPIGNLKEITHRAVEVLGSVDYIACEDTRTSRVLLDAYDIRKPLVAYHKFNETKASADIIRDLQNGKNVAVISDAGMPGISDPGAILVRAAIQAGVEYTVVSGPSALINAFVLSGYETPFTFIGFLPEDNKAVAILEKYAHIDSTLIFYCSPHSISSDLSRMYQVLGDREICVVREISKKFEDIHFDTLSTGYTGTLKGEFVVLVKKGTPLEQTIDVDKNMQTLLDMGLTKTDASKVIAKLTGTKKSDLYKRLNNN